MLAIGYVARPHIEGWFFEMHLQELENNGLSVINKERIFEVGPDDIVTYKSFQEPFDEESDFYLPGESRRKKLCEYMKENNYKIKPGVYTIGDSQSFEKIIKILKFEKIQ